MSTSAVPAEALEPISDGELIAGARRGQRDAREELARRYGRRAFLFAFQLLGNREDASDVAQDALLKFFDTLERFEAHRPIQPWLFRIVRNRAVDLTRRQSVRRADPLDELEGSREPRSRAEASPERRAERRELQRRLWRAVHSLPRKQREILVLRDYQDLTYAEISSVLGIPKGTVMSRLHGARQALRAVVLDSLGGTHD